MVRFVMSSVVHHVIDIGADEAVELIRECQSGSWDWQEAFHQATPEYQFNELLIGPEGSEQAVEKKR